MKIFHIDEDVFRMLPDYYVGVVAAEGLVNRQDNPAVADRLDQAIAAFADDFQGINLKEDPHIVPYRNAFRLMGINPNKYLCSIEALAKRVQKKKALPHINPAVDLGNAISLEERLPIGAHDVGNFCDGRMEVRLAAEGDTFLPMGGGELEKPDERELVYVSGHTVKTRRWTWRQSDDGKISEDTQAILFPIDGFYGVNEKAVAEAVQKLSDAVCQAFGCMTHTGIIDREHPTFSW